MCIIFVREFFIGGYKMRNYKKTFKQTFFLIFLSVCCFLFPFSKSYAGKFKEISYDDGVGLKGVILQFDDDEGRRDAKVIIRIDNLEKEISELANTIKITQGSGKNIVAVDFSDSDLTQECLFCILSLLKQYKIPFLDISDTYDDIREIIDVAQIDLNNFKDKPPVFDFLCEIKEIKNVNQMYIENDFFLKKILSTKLGPYKKEFFLEEGEE